jgi:hypothetical protein
MRTLVFGALKFDRESIPPELKALETWPTVDHSALDASRRHTYLQRGKAGVSLSADIARTALLRYDKRIDP